MDTRSKVLIVVFFTLVVAATVWKYDTFVLKRDYTVYDLIACDPASESCFAYECEEGDEECDDTPFKKLEKNASALSHCANYEEGACPTPSCGPEEEDCEITYCSEETLEDGEYCVEYEEEESGEEEMVEDAPEESIPEEEREEPL